MRRRVAYVLLTVGAAIAYLVMAPRLGNAWSSAVDTVWYCVVGSC